MLRKSKKKKVPKIRSSLPKAKHEAGSGKVVIFDGMNLAHTAYNAYRKLTYKGKSVSILFGMPSMIRSILSKLSSVEKAVIAWDGDKNPKRMEWLPTYKSHREAERDKNPELRSNFLKQCRRTRKLIYSLGIPQAYDKKIEGDDMIYLLSKNYQKTHKVTIVSGDKDMLQLVNNDVTVYNFRQDVLEVPGLIGAHHYGLKVEQLVDFYALVGDTSDDIPGYRGIAEVRGSAFLKVYGSIRAYLDNDKAEFSGMMDKDKLRKIYKRNKRMMDLRWFNDKFYPDYEIKYFKEQYPEFNDELLDSICQKYNLKTFRTDTFRNFFKELNDA